MIAMPQLIPITELRNRWTQVLSRLGHGPILLAQHSRPAAVMISVGEWDEMALEREELKSQLRRERALRLSSQQYTDDQLIDPAAYDQMLAGAGLDE